MNNEEYRNDLMDIIMRMQNTLSLQRLLELATYLYQKEIGN